jgi:hypothetical protein
MKLQIKTCLTYLIFLILLVGCVNNYTEGLKLYQAKFYNNALDYWKSRAN